MMHLVALTLVAAMSNAVSGYTPQTPQKQYAVAIFSVGSAWDQSKPPNEQKGFKEHSENLRRLRSEKKIVIGARYADKGIVIMEGLSVDEARAEFSADPTLKEKVFILEVHPFNAFFKGCLE
ncbi:MAG TPA: hypothetical protein VIL52_02880 [Bacteroidota bacterium]